MTPPSQYDEKKIRSHLAKCKERLVDLTKRNPLLGLNRSRVTKLRVKSPTHLDIFGALAEPNGASLKMPLVRKVEESQAQGPQTETPAQPKLELIPGDLSFDAESIQIQRGLRRIHDNAKTSVEERGVTTLFLTFGALKWTDALLEESIAPLWLVPCELAKRGPDQPMRLSRADDDATLNPALELYLRRHHKIELPTDFPDEFRAADLSKLLNSIAQKTSSLTNAQVLEDVWLSTFSFEALAIYKDLEALTPSALNNAMVAVFAGAAPLPPGSESLGEDQLDHLSTPKPVPIPLLTADSSQLSALTLACQERHLLIHGPPGTGKSQTIANLIALALGEGKKVLFVSAKMAALNVVHERLEKLGLGPFCLEAHSTKAGKAKIIEEIRRTYDAAKAGNGAPQPEDCTDWLKYRDRLNDYVRELHLRREPLGQSVFTAIARLEQLQSVPATRAPLPWLDIQKVRPDDLAICLEALRDLASQAGLYDARTKHPWHGLTFPAGSVPNRERLEDALNRLAATIRALSPNLNHLEPLLGAADSLSLEQLQAVAPTLDTLTAQETLPNNWTTRAPQGLRAASELMELAGRKAADLEALSKQLSKSVSIGFEEAFALLKPVANEFSDWTRFFRPSFWSWRVQTLQALRPGAEKSHRALSSYFVLAQKLISLKGWFDSNRSQILAETTENEWLAERSLLKTAEALRAAAQFLEAVKRSRLPRPRHDLPWTDEIRKMAKEVAATFLHDELSASIKLIDACWPKGFAAESCASKAPVAAAVHRSDECLSAINKFGEWIALQHTLNKCETLGLGAFLAKVEDQNSKKISETFEKRFLRSWIDAQLAESGILSQFSGAKHEELVRTFKETDAKIRRACLNRIKAKAIEAASQVAHARSDLPGGQVAILQKELNRKKGFKPLRRLFSEIPQILQALKPCMLMSPLSVSTFLESGTFSFDLVVFDEASQLPTPEALPSTLRSRQVVVAGDRNQLPPSSFFAASTIFDEEGDGVEGEDSPVLESFLDDCASIRPVFDEALLQWHYRSRNESLIKFSNNYFYDNSLITFPTPSPSGDSVGVRLEYVPDGIWDRGRSRTNRREAQRVVELIIAHLEKHPDRSLGVVAMNSTQREAIEEALDEALLSKPALAPLLEPTRNEPFFIKALESVQGDERDTIIVSIGYGKPADGGNPSMYFGPVTQNGGWRRLNVLVTRAKWQIILVTSLRSAELNVNPANRGNVSLRNYISFAEKCGQLPSDANPTDQPTNEFEDSVASALRERLANTELEIHEQVGASSYRIDLAIWNKTRFRYVLGIECDGATYHSGRTARDRDFLRHEALRKMGWRLHRLWSTDWFRDREKVLEAVLREVSIANSTTEESRQGEESSTPHEEPIDPPQQSKPNRAPSAKPPGKYPSGHPYRRFQPSQAGNPEYLMDSSLENRLAEQVKSIILFEGPIHKDLLIDRLKSVNDVRRIGDNIESNIDRALSRACRDGIEKLDKDFFAARGRDVHEFRTPGDTVRRTIDQIPPQELRLAILHLVENQRGYMRAKLPSAIAKVFGFERIREGMTEIVQTAIDKLVDESSLRESGNWMHLVD